MKAPMRLAIDARMAAHSGIGVYLRRVLPAVLEACADASPLLLVDARARAHVAQIAGAGADMLDWGAPPLAMAELRLPVLPAARWLWWTPHFNVPLMRSWPLVVTLHDLLPLADVPQQRAWPKRFALHAWLRAIRQRGVAVMCDSRFTQEQATRLGRIDAARTTVIPLGADRPTAAVCAPAVPYFLFVGLLKPHKNLAALLRAFERLAPTGPHRLVAVAKHSGVRDVDRGALALARRLAPRVELREDVPDAELARLIGGASALVQPSLYEGFGLPVLEAMAAGTPVIAARSAALPEVCGDAALYFDPRSVDDLERTLRTFVTDVALRERMHRAGIARATQYTWNACAGRTAGVVADACRRLAH